MFRLISSQYSLSLSLSRTSNESESKYQVRLLRAIAYKVVVVISPCDFNTILKKKKCEFFFFHENGSLVHKFKK